MLKFEILILYIQIIQYSVKSTFEKKGSIQRLDNLEICSKKNFVLYGAVSKDSLQFFIS